MAKRNRPDADQPRGRARAGVSDSANRPQQYGELRAYDFDPDEERMEGMDFRAEGDDPHSSTGEDNRSEVERGYDRAAHSGPVEYGVSEGVGGVFGTTGGGTYAGGFQVVERPALYDRSGAPGPFEPGRRPPEYGRDSSRFDSITYGAGREQQQRAPSHRGRGPRNYERSDERIEEELVRRLTDDDEVDATDIEVSVRGGEVSLSGTVDSRYQRRIADEIAEETPGVRQVFNALRVLER